MHAWTPTRMQRAACVKQLCRQSSMPGFHARILQRVRQYSLFSDQCPDPEGKIARRTLITVEGDLAAGKDQSFM